MKFFGTFILKITLFHKIRKKNAVFRQRYVAPLGLEPRQTEPESAVLPLHHKAVLFEGAKVHNFSALSNKIYFYRNALITSIPLA